MELLAGVCLLLFVSTATITGARLLWVGLRTGHRPEQLLGAGSLLVATIGLPLSIASGFGGEAGKVQIPLWVVSEFVTQIGIVCLYAFTQQVFRAGVRWAEIAIALVAIALPCCLAGAALGLAAAPPETLSVVATGGWLLLCHAGYGGSFLWSAAEGLSHYQSARRRLAIGLVDPVVANRFLLFAIYGIACTVISIANAAAVVLELDIARSLVVLLPSAVCSLVAGAAMYLAILPPAWFVERLRAEHGRGF